MKARASILVAVAALGAAIASAACGDDASTACRVGADCASGACRSDGTCAEPTVGPDGGDVTDAARDADSGTTIKEDGSSADGAGLGCPTGNNDGVLTRAEVPLAAGLRATFRVAKDVAVSTAGATKPDGTRHWDFSAALAGDHALVLETISPTGTWYAADYAGATYVARLADSADLLGVFEITPDALLLRGVVSPSDGATTRTKLTYSPVPSVLTLPMQKGSKWKTRGTVSGQAQGFFVNYTEATDYEVDATGDLVTPLGTYPVYRVKALLTRTVGFAVTTVRSFAFVAECAGTVARVTSADNESTEEFTTASEIQRTAP